MSRPDRDKVLEIVTRITRPEGSAPKGIALSILSQSATSFGTRPEGADATMPTGFDPVASALFEALIESAFLVANADGVIDVEERDLIEAIVVAACEGAVPAPRVHWLFSQFDARLATQGLDGRLRSITEGVERPEHQKELLRVAAIIGNAARPMTDTERSMMEKIAAAFGMDAKAAVEEAVTQARG